MVTKLMLYADVHDKLDVYSMEIKRQGLSTPSLGRWACSHYEGVTDGMRIGPAQFKDADDFVRKYREKNAAVDKELHSDPEFAQVHRALHPEDFDDDGRLLDASDPIPEQIMPTWQAAWEVQQCSEDDIWVYQREADAANADVDRLWGSVGPEPEPEDGDDVGYLVYRFAGVDYVAAPEHFRAITSPDDYHFMASTGWIDVPHGEAPQIERNLLEYIRNEAAKGALPGGIGEIIN